MNPSHTPVYKTVTLTAVGAECLENVTEGDALSFLYRRGEKFFLSEPSTAFPDTAVYWDAMSVQTCRLEAHKKKYLKLFVQKVPVGPDGLPTDFGTLLAVLFPASWVVEAFISKTLCVWRGLLADCLMPCRLCFARDHGGDGLLGSGSVCHGMRWRRARCEGRA